ncbi:MAG: hypothetical protein KDD44_11170, partial [Bdellovibrionales bacterium]|nr:hypothetical protein [Bdellovibrionales bacterium]
AETSAEKAETTKKASRVVVIGDADFAANVNISLLANRDFVLNVVNWLLGSEESISIRPRTLRSASTPVDERQFSALFAISVLIVPELILAIGLWVWCARRRSAEVLA